MTGKSIVLGGFLEGPGITWSDWRHPGSTPDAFYSLAWFKKMARTFEEEAGYDFMFLADNVGVTQGAAPYQLCRLEPLTVMSAIASVTEHIGLAATLTTTFAEPYNAARLFSSLDHLSGGRAAWNVVTSYSDTMAANFGMTRIMDHDSRYKRAEEFLDVCRKLWDSWDEDAMVHDRDAKVFADPNKIHAINHRGENFAVAGPLNICRSPQGHPVIFQAGTSEAGRDFAAQHADCLFFTPYSIEEAKEFTRDVKARVRQFGRAESDLKVVPTIAPFIGSTKREAEEKWRERAALVETNDALNRLSKFVVGYDFSACDIDGPPPELPPTSLDGLQGYALRLMKMAKDDNLSLRQLASLVALPDGTGTMVGTPEEIADIMQRWVDEGACDGFMMLEGLPGEHATFIEHVLPILRQRGIRPHGYAGKTLRENLGLGRVRPN